MNAREVETGTMPLTSPLTTVSVYCRSKHVATGVNSPFLSTPSVPPSLWVWSSYCPFELALGHSPILQGWKQTLGGEAARGAAQLATPRRYWVGSDSRQ